MCPGLSLFSTQNNPTIPVVSHTFGKAERLKSRKLIQTLFKEGKSFVVFPFKVMYMPLPPASAGSASNKAFPVQAAFGVSSRHFPKAVDRNRIKRLSREAYRLQKHDLYTLLQEKDRRLLVFFLYTDRHLPHYHLVNDKISVILSRLSKELGSEKNHP